MNRYEVGDLVRVTGTFATASVNTDPSVVSFKYKDPSQNVTTLVYGTDAALVKSAVGIYYVDVNADEAGVWKYRFWSTGTGQAANEDSFQVKNSSFT